MLLYYRMVIIGPLHLYRVVGEQEMSNSTHFVVELYKFAYSDLSEQS